MKVRKTRQTNKLERLIWRSQIGIRSKLLAFTDQLNVIADYLQAQFWYAETIVDRRVTLIAVIPVKSVICDANRSD